MGNHAISSESQAGEHPAHLAHHFDNPQTQFEAAKLGMWLFLVTEILLFGGLFMGYTILRWQHPEAFSQASHLLDTPMGALNTVVLITSSLTMALAVWASQRGDQKKLIIFLVSTLVLAGCFLVVKYFEYTHKFHMGVFPGKWYAPNAEALEILAGHAANAVSPYTGNFFGIYYVMTGIHGLHVVIGMGIIAWVLVKALRGHFSAEYNTPVDVSGLYWHLVDLIWIFLFPLLYLIH